MKRINSIIESEFAPASKNDMWLFKGSLKYFGPKGWADVISDVGEIPAATPTTIGGVKMGAAVANIATGADAAAIVTSVNSLLTSLRNAGIITT